MKNFLFVQYDFIFVPFFLSLFFLFITYFFIFVHYIVYHKYIKIILLERKIAYEKALEEDYIHNCKWHSKFLTDYTRSPQAKKDEQDRDGFL